MGSILWQPASPFSLFILIWISPLDHGQAILHLHAAPSVFHIMMNKMHSLSTWTSGDQATESSPWQPRQAQ